MGFLQGYCLTGDQMTVGAWLVFCKSGGCQHVCSVQEFDLVLMKKLTACQSQFILYLYLQYGISTSSAAPPLGLTVTVQRYLPKIVIKEVFCISCYFKLFYTDPLCHLRCPNVPTLE